MFDTGAVLAFVQFGGTARRHLWLYLWRKGSRCRCLGFWWHALCARRFFTVNIRILQPGGIFAFGVAMSRLTIFLVIHAHKHFVGQSSPVLMHYLSYKTHTRVLMPPCKWLNRIIHVAHQGMQHLQQPQLISEHGKSASLHTVARRWYSTHGMHRAGDQTDEPVLLHVVGRNILPSRAPCLLNFVGGREERAPPAPTRRGKKLNTDSYRNNYYSGVEVLGRFARLCARAVLKKTCWRGRC